MKFTEHAPEAFLWNAKKHIFYYLQQDLDKRNNLVPSAASYLEHNKAGEVEVVMSLDIHHAKQIVVSLWNGYYEKAQCNYYQFLFLVCFTLYSRIPACSSDPAST